MNITEIPDLGRSILRVPAVDVAPEPVTADHQRLPDFVASAFDTVNDSMRRDLQLPLNFAPDLTSPQAWSDFLRLQVKVHRASLNFQFMMTAGQTFRSQVEQLCKAQ